MRATPSVALRDLWRKDSTSLKTWLVTLKAGARQVQGFIVRSTKLPSGAPT